MRKSVLGLILIGVMVAATYGDIIPTLNPAAPAFLGNSSGGPLFTWNYTANVTVDQSVTTGSFFTIYDFGNFLPLSNMQPAGWTFSSSLVGATPSLVTPTDNPALANLTWTYTGTTPISGGAALGNFSVVVVRANQLRSSDFAAEAVRSGGPNVGTVVDNVGQVSVPVPEMSALLPILSVCGVGLVLGLPTALRRRKKI
jgi:hypothetical protein